MVDRIAAMRRIVQQLTTEMGREPTNDELSTVMELPLTKIAHLQTLAKRSTSLDAPVGEEGDATLGDLMDNGQGTPEDAVMALVDSELLSELLGTLDDRARYAVEARFGLLDGERRSFREVGESLGVTAEAARRLVSRAVAGLREDDKARALLGA
jgi:RNA polymerase primary sigma factor